jgi:hypothetical protein
LRLGLWAIACGISLSAGCDITPSHSDGVAASAKTDTGFEAVITGAYDGNVVGAGTLVLLPGAGFEKQGYYFLADGRGLRPHGVTFVLPRGIGTGKHTLASPPPLELGKVASVRVDRDTGDAAVSSDRATVGELELVSFPANEDALGGADIAGRFQFETADANGRKIQVKGRFAFTVPVPQKDLR